jgi:transposase-like protein
MRKKRAIDKKKEKYWRDVFGRFQASGLPFRKFCEQEGISPNTFQYWRKELRLRDEERGVKSKISKGENRPTYYEGKIDEWKKHITAARKHPKGVADYCRRNKLASQTFYGWLARLKQIDPSWELPAATTANKSANAVFVPVSIKTTDEKTKRTAPASKPIPQRTLVERVELRLPSGVVICLPTGTKTSELVALAQALGAGR